MNKKKSESLISKPFVHENLDFKNALVDYSRKLRNESKDNFEAQLVSAVIYSSTAEYLAGFLLESLRHLVYEASYRQLGAIVFIDMRKLSTGTPLNDLIKGLQLFEFPDKAEIIELLNSIKTSRNDLFHNFAKKDKDSLNDIGENIILIQSKTEQLIQKVNTVNISLQNIYYPPIQQGESNKNGTTP